jgi:hypothetical protein
MPLGWHAFMLGCAPLADGVHFKALDIRLHPLPSAAIALPRGHAALAFVKVGVGFVDRAAAVAVGFLRICGFYISASV